MTLLDEVMQLDRSHSGVENEILKKYSLRKESVNAKNRKKITTTLVISVVISIVLGIIVGRFIFVHKIYGAQTICYTTNYGECYHAAGCGYLWNSSHKTSVYQAKRRGFEPCSRCSVGKLDESNKYEYGWGIFACMVVVVPFPVILKIKENKQLENHIDWEMNSRLDRNKQTCKSAIDEIVKENGILKIINAPSEVTYRNGTIICSDEKHYRYISTYGKCYHSNPHCGNNLYRKVWAYDIKGLLPCYKCAQVVEIPNWYSNYIKLCSVLKKYGLEHYQ